MEIKTIDFKIAPFTGQIVECTKKDKMEAGFKKLAVFWGIMVASVFIPVFHFVLVPLFFFVGLGFFFQQTKQTHMVKQLSFICPDCGKENKIEKMYFKESIRFRCQHCSTQLILS